MKPAECPRVFLFEMVANDMDEIQRLGPDEIWVES